MSREHPVAACVWAAVVLAAVIHPARATHHDHPALSRETYYPIGTNTPGGNGPWGGLSLTTVILEPSPDLFTPALLTSQAPVWTFPGRTTGDLKVALHQAGLSQDQIATLLASHRPDPNRAAVILQPPEELLTNLDPDVRSRLYALLDDGEGSDAYRYPIHFPAKFRPAWYRQASVSNRTRDMLDRLVYARGDMLYFSDLRYLYSTIDSVAERRNLAAALLRQPTLIGRIYLPTPEAVEAAVAYWGQTHREALVRPLLEAAQREGANPGVDLTLLLPPLARRYLYTYPTDQADKFLDCRWTTLNFMTEQPDDRFLQQAEVARTLQEDYVSVPDHFALGDVILLRNRQGDVIHMCNYVADNLVFTKNGGDRGQPWMLSTLHDVINYYTIGGDIPAYLVLRHR